MEIMNNMIDENLLGTLIISLLLGVLLLMYKLKSWKISFEMKNKASIVVQLNNKDDQNKSYVSLGEDKTDVIIVGAGVAGSAFACTLAKDGRRVHVIERELSEPDRMVGEFLQPGGYLKLGLEDCVKDIDAQRAIGLVVYKDGKNTTMSFPLEKFHPDVSAKCFHNGRFIQKMRDKAATFPNVKLEEGTVTSLIEQNGMLKGVNYKIKDGRVVSANAPLTIVCDGCFSNLRRSLCNPKVERPSSFVGLILKNCELPYANHGVTVMAEPSAILFYRISSTEIRCMVDIPAAQKLPSIANGEMANYLNTVMAPQDLQLARSLDYTLPDDR